MKALIIKNSMLVCPCGALLPGIPGHKLPNNISRRES